MERNLLKFWTLLLIAVSFSTLSIAQVTTANIEGVVYTPSNELLPGANIVAVHTESGTTYGAVSNIDGRFTIPDVRVGGPYTITISFIGYNNTELKDIYLKLGEVYNVLAKLTEGSVSLDDVVVVGKKDEVFDKKRTGSAINIDRKAIAELPTISRSSADFTRLTPMADGNSFGGRNNQFNNFSLDGSIFNNPFGLDAATPGGQTNAQPISLDAIDQIQVSIAPYDVTQAGFTGAAVNAVTKSGTNDFKGTVYSFYRNQNMVGNTISGQELDKADLNHSQVGFSIGGPIIKNKLFFFANFEVENRNDLGSPFKARRSGDVVGENISRISYDDMVSVKNALANIQDAQGNKVYSYNPGAFEGYMHQTSNEKGIFKIDWNINEKNTLSAKYNFLRARKDNNAHPSAIGRRGPDLITLQFENAGYQINNNIDSWILELNSRFENASNKLLVGYTKFDDWRDAFSEPFPTVQIAQAGVRAIVAGHEPFSIHNILEQQVFQATDNFNYYLGKHTFTAGVSFEKFMFNNSFNLGAYPGVFSPDYGSVADFVTATQNGSFWANVQAAQSTYNAANWSWAKTNVGQAAAYIQDKWNIKDNFSLTYGVRFDMPLYFNTGDMLSQIIADNASGGANWTTSINGVDTGGKVYFDSEGNKQTIDHTKLPNQKVLISPRIGFNWDVKSDKSMQVRGGTGLFTGRLPFVWIGNQVQNYNFWYFNSTAADFKFPQVWRSNIGFDSNLGNGFTVETDFIYTRDIAAPVVKNYALGTPTGSLAVSNYGDNRPIYNSADEVTVYGGATNAYVFDNVNGGYSFNATIQIKKSFENGVYTSLGYNYLDAKDYSSIAAEITGDAYDRNPHYGNANNLMLAPSMYGNKHRFVFVAAKTFEWSQKWSTTLSLVGETSQGGRFNYTYSGDINNDHSGLNDLIYIPTANEVSGAMTFNPYVIEDFNNPGNTITVTEAQQKTAFEAYIQQDSYLSSNRGKFAEKYAILSPWYTKFDFRLMQDYNFNISGRKNTIQFTLDVMNIGNMFNSDWGVRKLPSNTQPIGVSVDPVTKVPTYTFDVEQNSTFTDDFSILSRWQLQLGVRYIF